MDLRGIGSAARPDAAVHYRVDGTGTRVGVMPATCKLGIHSLAATGYRAIAADGELRISCTACADVPDPNHAWWLITSGPTPDRAELDDEPYRDVVPYLVGKRLS